MCEMQGEPVTGHPDFVHQGKKVTFTLEQARKAQRGSRGVALLFL
jgi:hypothetical protein